MKIRKIKIKTRSKNYQIIVGRNLISIINKILKDNNLLFEKCLIVVDKNIPGKSKELLYKRLNSKKLFKTEITPSEKIKNYKTIDKIHEILFKNRFNREDCVISFGGGIVGDIAGFASSTFKRGIKFINIPSTLLAQVDSSIGGKTGINSNKGKNLIGTFYQPSFVIVDISILNTLPYREMVCGYAEILKHSLILDKKFFIWLTKNAKKIIEKRDKKLLNLAIIKSCKIKSSVIAKDEREKDIRKILNFGHTFAHGFEGAANFSKKMNHGEAVLLGMMTAIEFAYKKKIFNSKDYIMIKKHYLDLNLPMNIKKKFTSNKIDKIISFMKKDKKNYNEKINLILLKKIGKTIKPNKIYVNDWVIKKFLKSIYNK